MSLLNIALGLSTGSKSVSSRSNLEAEVAFVSTFCSLSFEKVYVAFRIEGETLFRLNT